MPDGWLIEWVWRSDVPLEAPPKRVSEDEVSQCPSQLGHVKMLILRAEYFRFVPGY